MEQDTVLEIVTICACILWFRWFIRNQRKQDATPKVWGGAWATVRQMAKAGMFKHRGIPIGYVKRWWGKKRLFFNPQKKGRSPHIIDLGSTGAGKSSQGSLPAALAWGQSLIMLDVGGEGVCVAGDYRQRLGRAMQWNPYHLHEGHTRKIRHVSINPMGPRYLDPKSRDYDLRLIKLGKCSVDQHSNDTGNSRFFYHGAAEKGSDIIGTVVEYGKPEERNLAHCCAIANDDLFAWAKWLMENHGDDPRIRKRWASWATKDARNNKAMWDIVYTLLQEWNWMKDEAIMASLKDDQFDPIECKERVTSIFYVLPQSDLDVMAPPLRFLTAWNIARTFCRAGKNIPILMEVEEYFALQMNGRLSAIDEVLAGGRKFNLYLLLCIQNWPEILYVQGHDLAYHFLNSAGCVQWMNATDPLGSDVLSHWLGQKDIKVPNWSSGVSQSPGYAPGGKFMPPMPMMHTSRSSGENVTIQPHPIMTGQEIRALADEMQICMVQGVRAPILCHREAYWDTWFLKRRARPNPFYK